MRFYGWVVREVDGDSPYRGFMVEHDDVRDTVVIDTGMPAALQAWCLDTFAEEVRKQLVWDEDSA